MTENVEPHILKRYKLLKKVGSGAYGHVWKVEQYKTNQILALKKIFDAFQHSTDAQRTYRQITLLNKLNNDYIIKLHRVIKADNDKDLYLVFEFMQADLHNAIGQKILKQLHMKYVLFQLVKGIKYLHDSNIMHRDLKPSNLLINSDCAIKICDLGLARTIQTKNPAEDSIFTEQVATRWYRAPEVLLGSQNYGEAADIWSIGCILAEMLTGKPFFPGNSTLNQLQKIVTFTGRPSKTDIESISSPLAESMLETIGKINQKKPRQIFKPQISQEAIDLVMRTICFNPNKRLTASQMLKHPFIRQFNESSGRVPKVRKIYPEVSENNKRSVKQYKKLIYQWINETYGNEESYGEKFTLFKQTEKQSQRSVTSESSKYKESNIIKEKVSSKKRKNSNMRSNSSIIREKQSSSLHKRHPLKESNSALGPSVVRKSNSVKYTSSPLYESTKFGYEKPNTSNLFQKRKRSQNEYRGSSLSSKKLFRCNSQKERLLGSSYHYDTTSYINSPLTPSASMKDYRTQNLKDMLLSKSKKSSYIKEKYWQTLNSKEKGNGYNSCSNSSNMFYSGSSNVPGGKSINSSSLSSKYFYNRKKI